MNQLVISGTRRHGISGTHSSSLQEPEHCLSRGSESRIRASNLSNPESFGFFLTERLVPEDCGRRWRCALPIVRDLTLEQWQAVAAAHLRPGRTA